MIGQNLLHENRSTSIMRTLASRTVRFPRHAVIAAILVVALLAFEVFNFDTTRYALENLLGPVSFAGLGWATVLAIAFCAIDFAGLVRLFTPDVDGGQPKEVWYLMGAWLLGATMNAVMTWWAVSLTLLNHEFGNEVLTRAQLLHYVPVFVAVLVWLTRILFIGALTMTGGHLLARQGQEEYAHRRTDLPLPKGRPLREPRVASSMSPGTPSGIRDTVVSPAAIPHTSDELPSFLRSRHESKRDNGVRDMRDAPVYDRVESGTTQESEDPAGRTGHRASRSSAEPNRVRQRPPLPGLENGAANRRAANGK